jgi:hypothetical protein
MVISSLNDIAVKTLKQSKVGKTLFVLCIMTSVLTSAQAQKKIDEVISAGFVTPGFSGDGGVSKLALMNNPYGIAIDAQGNVYVADYGNHVVRKHTALNGKIATVAGTGVAGATGDGGLATAAKLFHPTGVALDAAKNLYIADADNNKVRKVAVASGKIFTIAGSTLVGDAGDGGQAIAAKLNKPSAVALDASNNIYIADEGNHRIKKVNATTGIITTVVGVGTAGYAGDGGLATVAQINAPTALVLDASGNIYFSDNGNNVVRKVTVATGVIATIAGTGVAGFSGDDGLATLATLDNPRSIVLDANSNVYIADANNNRIRMVNGAGVISTVVGTGAPAANPHQGNGGNPKAAVIGPSRGIAVFANDLYLSEFNNHAVRVVNNVILPVELIGFKATVFHDKIQLQWKTTHEVNSDFFRLMRSVDGHHFVPIGVVSAHGNSNQTLTYEYDDDDALDKQIYYYKLFEQDKDGQSQESSIVMASNENVNNHHLRHQIQNGKSLLYFHSLVGGKYSVQMIDNMGNHVFKNEFEGLIGENMMEVNHEKLSNGIYFIHFNGPDYNHTILKVLMND